MKVDLTQKIEDFDGKPFSGLDQDTVNVVVDNVRKVYKDMHGDPTPLIKRVAEKMEELHITLGWVLKKVLAKGLKDDSEDKVFEYFVLGSKCTGDEVELSDDERMDIKRLVRKVEGIPIIEQYRPIFVGNVAEMLESNSEPESKKKGKKG